MPLCAAFTDVWTLGDGAVGVVGVLTCATPGVVVVEVVPGDNAAGTLSDVVVVDVLMVDEEAAESTPGWSAAAMGLVFDVEDVLLLLLLPVMICVVVDISAPTVVAKAWPGTFELGTEQF